MESLNVPEEAHEHSRCNGQRYSCSRSACRKALHSARSAALLAPVDPDGLSSLPRSSRQQTATTGFIGNTKASLTWGRMCCQVSDRPRVKRHPRQSSLTRKRCLRPTLYLIDRCGAYSTTSPTASENLMQERSRPSIIGRSWRCLSRPSPEMLSGNEPWEWYAPQARWFSLLMILLSLKVTGKTGPTPKFTFHPRENTVTPRLFRKIVYCSLMASDGAVRRGPPRRPLHAASA
jgi:hypothetical protein